MFKTTELVKSVFQLLFWAAIAWLVYTVRGMIVYLVVGAILTVMGKPIVRKLHSIQLGKFRIPLWICSILTIVIFASILVGGASLLIPELVSEITMLSKIDYNSVFKHFEGSISAVQTLIQDWNILPEVSESDLRDSMAEIFNLHTIRSTFGTLVGGLGNVGIAMFSIIFILFFFLKEQRLADAFIENFVNAKYTKSVEAVIPKVKKTLTRYFIGLTIQLAVIFTLVYLGLSLIGIQNAVVIALFAATMNVIPYIGPIIGIGFGLVLGLGQELAIDPSIDILLTTGKILSVFVVIQLLDNIVSQPLIFSNSINAHPLEIFIVISIAGTLAGIAGMVIAVPLYSVLRIIAKESKVNVKFIETLSKNA